MSEHLKAFLTAWIEWAEGGAPDDDEPFSRHRGLCSNFSRWMYQERTPYEDMSALRCQLDAAFVSDGMDCCYPFGSEDSYNEYRDNRTQHLNEARLAWVRSKVAQYEVV